METTHPLVEDTQVHGLLGVRHQGSRPATSEPTPKALKGVRILADVAARRQ
jgi:hypothetical protein